MIRYLFVAACGLGAFATAACKAKTSPPADAAVLGLAPLASSRISGKTIKPVIPGKPIERVSIVPSRKPVTDPEAETRRLVGPALLRVNMAGEGGYGTAFACAVPGIACTAKHVVGSSLAVQVTSANGRSVEAPVVAVHPEDDIALLDIRALGLAPLPLSHVDTPIEGTLVCRLGHPPSHPTRPFARCDPSAGVLHEASARNDGTVAPRLVHLGIGLKGDSGAPLFDPATGLVVGIHVSEANGSGRASLPTAVHDLLIGTRPARPWIKGCAQDGPNEFWKRSLLLSCADVVDDARASHFCHLGAAYLALNRRGEALSAFEEALALDPYNALGWLWRALVYPKSAHAQDDAALAFRMEPDLRVDDKVTLLLPSAWHATARALREQVAPTGTRLVTLIGDGACDACPAFCAAARSTPNVKLWAVEGMNHPAAAAFFQSMTPTPDGGTGPIVGVGDRAAYGCDALKP